ncbi:hypothetical protein BRC64_01390, partial [Halobacteriales archaeon QH_10_67_22]
NRRLSPWSETPILIDTAEIGYARPYDGSQLAVAALERAVEFGSVMNEDVVRTIGSVAQEVGATIVFVGSGCVPRRTTVATPRG